MMKKEVDKLLAPFAPNLTTSIHLAHGSSRARDIDFVRSSEDDGNAISNDLKR